MTPATDVDVAASVAVSLAKSLGLGVATTSVLNAGANLGVRLEPMNVVARVVAEVESMLR